MTSKKRLSARINQYNYDMLKDLADTVFYDEKKNRGNVSEALDCVLTLFRLSTKYSGLMKNIQSYANIMRGHMGREDIEVTKVLVTLMKIVTDEQDSVAEAL